MATIRQLKVIEGDDFKKRMDLVQSLFDADALDDEVLRAIITSEGKHGVLPGTLLAKIISRTQSSELYERAKYRLFQDIWSLLEVFKGDYPDRAIEERLLEELPNWYDRNDPVIRKQIVIALGDHGSTDAVRLLTELLAEHIPKVQTKEVLADAMRQADALDDIEYSPLFIAVEREFVELLAEAIEKITARRTLPRGRGAGEMLLAEKSRTVLRHEELGEKVSRLRELALSHREADPRAALLNVRLATEAICKTLCRENGIVESKKKEPLDQVMLGDILVVMRGAGILPGHVEGIAVGISRICGAALHDQGKQSPEISSRVAALTLAMLDELVDWFFGSSSIRR
ncbi:MAG: hypothetical protein K1X67_14830 [Fimbriimonadaceae bacterium]|nr:hypothetical protein [Fimbriimonadaceae bacterium]